MMVRRIIYISNSLIGTAPDEWGAIFSSSIRWNTKKEVTGMLWVTRESFAQVIEGAANMVEITMDRIRADRRHTGVEVLLDREVFSRQFGNWSMRRAGDDETGIRGTAFIIGFALSERTIPARRLYKIILESIE